MSGSVAGRSGWRSIAALVLATPIGAVVTLGAFRHLRIIVWRQVGMDQTKTPAHGL
jgi:hypothetical protein